MDPAGGGLVTRDSIASTVVPAHDMSVVGVALPAALLPGEPLRAGDQVQVVATPGQQGDVDEGSSGPSPPPWSGSTRPPIATRQWSASRCLADQAAELAARAATGKVALVLDSRER